MQFRVQTGDLPWALITMAKSAKTKKEKKADFSKVKLKVGKKLPKGRNATDTGFKTKKIIINSQLRTHDQDVPVTKRNLDLKELLAHLRHYSVYVRQDGVNGLRELLTSHSQLIVPNLGRLLGSLAALLIDEDQKLRTETVKFLSDIIKQVSENQLRPFFSVLVTHLTCAMTHLSGSVQQSSLPLLAALLQLQPALLSGSADLLLPTLLDQISRRGSGPAPAPARTLLADPGTKLTAASWRVTVLSQLAHFLRAQRRQLTADRPPAPHRRFGQSNWRGIYRQSTDPRDCDVTRPAEFGQQRRILREPDQLKAYCESVMPLLFQTYAEVAPDKDKNGSLLPEVAADALEAILKVISELLHQMSHLDGTKSTTLVSWFTDTYQPELSRHILSSFPFTRLPGRTPKKRDSTPSTAPPPSGADRNCDVINVLVCDLVTRMGRGGNAEARSVGDSVLEYLTEYLHSDRCAELNRVCAALHDLLAGCASDSELPLECVRAAAARQGRLQDAEHASHLTSLLMAIVTQPEYQTLVRTEMVERWCAELLPGLRSGQASVDLFALLRTMASRGGTSFLSTLDAQAAGLLTDLVTASDLQWQRAVVELLHWTTEASAEAQAAYQKLINSEVDVLVKNYARQVLQHKMVPFPTSS